AHVCRRDLEPAIDERTYYAGGRPNDVDARFASLNRIKALPPQYQVGFINKQSRPERIFVTQWLIEDHLMVGRRRDVPDDQIDQGRPVDVVAKSSVFQDLPTVFSDESLIGVPER